MPNSLSPGDGQDLLARIKQAREGRDPDKMVELFAEDAEYYYDPFEPPLVGANDIRRYWNDIAADQTDVEFDPERVWVVGRTVLGSWHSAHSVRSSAARIRVRGFATMELDEVGRISRMREWSSSRKGDAG
jgi:hypothetical protein